MSDNSAPIGIDTKARPNQLLRDYYRKLGSLETPATAASTLSIKAKVDPSNMETDAFDAGQYLKGMLTESTMAELLKKDNDLITEMKQIDSDRKTLFYENYSKLINASDTIKDMRENVESMEKELIKLSQQIQDITSLASSLHGTFVHKKTQVYNLKNSASLLRRLQFLFTLPKRLSKSAKDGSYLRAVQFFSTTKDTLERYQHVPVFAKVATEAKSAVTQIRTSIFQKLKKGDLSYPQLIEAMQVLIAIAMDPPTKLIDLLLENGLRIISVTLKQDVPWLPLVSAIHSDATALFKSEQSEVAQLKKTPLILFLPPNDFFVFQGKLEQFLKSAFDLWEAHFQGSEFLARLDRHVAFRKQLEAFAEISELLSSHSAAIMESILTEEMLRMTTASQAALLAGLQQSPEQLDELFATTVRALKEKVEDIRAQLANDPQMEIFQSALPTFLEKVYGAPGLEPASKLALVQLAQSIALNALDEVFKEDAAAMAEIKALSKKAAEQELAAFVNTQALSLETVMQEWKAPNGHPKGISPCLHVLCKQLHQVHQIVHRVFRDGQDTVSVDSPLRRKKGQGSTGSSIASFTHHPTTSASSVRSSPPATLAALEKPQGVKTDRFFSEKITFYAQPEINGCKYPVMPLILRIFAKGWLEHVRCQTLTKFGFQQIIVDVEFCKLHFNDIVKDRHVLALLEDVVTSAYQRCVDPQFLSKESITTILRAQDPIEDMDKSVA